MSSSLEDWIKDKKKEDEEKKKAEEAKAEEAKAKAASMAYRSERTKDDAAFPTAAKPVVQDERKEAVATKRGDIASVKPAPVVKPVAAPSYIPSSFAPAQAAPVQGPPKPIYENADNDIERASNSWRTKPDIDISSLIQPQAYRPPDVSVSFDRPDTGVPSINDSRIPNPISPVQPYTPPKQYDFVKPQPTTVGQPWQVGALGVGEGQQGGGLLGQYGQQAGNALKSWLTPSAPGQAGPHGAMGQDASAAQNSTIDYLKDFSPAQAIRDYTATTGYGQAFNAQIAKNREGVDPNAWGANAWADVKDLGALASLAGGVIENSPILGVGQSAGIGTGLKTGQVVQAGLTVPARVLVPTDKQSIWRNPQTFNTPGIQESKAALDQLQQPGASELPIDQLAAKQTQANPMNAVGNWMKDTFMAQINKAQAVNKYIQSLPPEQQNKVQIAYSIMASGPEAMKSAVDSILGQGQKVQELTKQAQEAQAQAANPALTQEQQQEAALRAAQYGAQAKAEQNMNALDYVDKYTHPGAQLMQSLVTDPLNYLPVDKLWDAYKAQKAAKVFDVSTEQAMKVMPKALEDARALLDKPLLVQDATKLVDAGAQKASVLGPTFWENFNPFKPTAESMAQQSTTKIWNAATQLMSGVTTKEDARLLVQSWVDNPTKLVEGVTGLTSPTAQSASVDGVYKVGAGIVANKPLLDVMPVLQAAGDKLKNLTSLAGEGTFNPTVFAAEIDNAVYETARGLYGLDPLEGLDAAVAGTKPVLARLPDGTGVINYVDKAGKVIKSTAPKVFYDASVDFKNLQTAGKAAGSNPIASAAGLTFQIQRALLSDMYLALSPGHWVRNAASATATLLTDGLYGTKNQGEMIRDLTTKFGDIFPERELQNTIAGTGQEIPHIAERLVGKNPYSTLVNKANEVWTGLTNVAGVPFGEQSFKLTAKYNSFQRIFRNVWKEAAGGEFKAGLDALGIAPEVANTLTHHVVDAGIQGNKQTLAEATRAILNSSTIKTGLRELGVPDELLSMEGWAGINDVLSTHLPEQIDEATQAIKQIFTDELTRRGKILNDAPPQLGNHPWMQTETAHDSAALIDTLREAGKQAGLPVEQVESTVQTLAKNLEESMTGAWDKFRQELPQTANPQEALGLAFDTYAKHSELKQAARAGVDELGRKAATAQSTEAWAQKWQGTQEIYTKLVQDTQQLFAGTRARILGVQGGAVEPFNWWKAIERYANYDEAAVQQARVAGSTLGSTASDQAAWTASIDAGRQYVDKSLLELYDAFRSHPTQESLDLLVASQNKIDNMGAQAAAHLKPLRDTAMQSGDWAAYYAERNKVWGQYFDNAAIHNKATQRIIVADGVTSKYGGALTWEDPMYGSMRLIAPETKTLVDNSSKARGFVKAQTGIAAPRVHNFDSWQVADANGNVIQVADKYVPDEAKTAWSKIVNPDDEINATIAMPAEGSTHTAPVATAPIDPQKVIASQGGQTATQLAQQKIALQGSSPVTSLRQLAKDAGIRIVDEKGYSSDTDVIKAINEELKKVGAPRISRLDNLTPEQYTQARDALQGRLGRIVPATTPPIPVATAAPTQSGTRIITSQELMDAQKNMPPGLGMSNISPTSQYASAEVQKTLDAGGTAVMWNDGKRIDIVSIKDGMAVDTNGQQWGFMSLVMGNPSKRNELELIGGAASKLPVQGPVANTPIFDPFKLEAGETVEKTLADNVAKSRTTNGTKAPEMGEALGTHMLDKLKAAEQKVLGQLQTILTGQPNTLTEAQRVGAMDLLNQLLPAYDNALAGASKGASDAMNFGMLDPSNRRNADVWLSHLFPFHYFWSRSAKNWAERILVKPGVIHAYYMEQQAVAIENKQAGVPARLEGTWPMKSQVGFGPDRIADPLIFALPFAGYYQNQYINPEDANTEFEKWAMRVQQFTPGLMPAIQAGINAGMDVVDPKADGTKRFKASDYAPQRFIPGIDLAGYAYQAATGKTPTAKLPEFGNAPVYGDEFDPYRIGRKAAELFADKADTRRAQDIAQYTQQYAQNLMNGKPPLDKIPTEYQADVTKWYPLAAQGAAKARLMSKAGSFLTGVPGYEYTPEEQMMQRQQNELYKLGYNEWDNQFGSKAAMSQYRQENPELRSWQSKGALVPNDNNPLNDKTTPAVSAQTTDKIDDSTAIKQAQAKAVETFLNAHNGKATYDEITAIKAPFKAQLDALETKYPNAGAGGNGGVPLNMNPQERAEWQKNQLVFGRDKPIAPGPDATPEQKAKYAADVKEFEASAAPENPGKNAAPDVKLAYYAALEKFNNARLDRMDKSANAVFSEQGDPPTGASWQDPFKQMTKGQYSANIVSDAYLANVSEAEQKWSYAMNLDNEVSSAGRAAGMAAVKAALPPDTYKLYELYTAMPKGSDEKKAFLKDHPELAEANMIAYNAPQYAELTKRFGPNALAVLANAPKYDEGEYANQTDDQKAAHNGQVAAYAKAHPEYNAIKLWMNGRPHLYQKAPNGQFPAKDYGKDYTEAIKIFGPNVFEALSNYPPKGSTPATYNAFYTKYPKFKGYFEWLNEMKDTPPNYVAGATQDDNKFLDMANWYNGPRPYDSGRQPIGVTPVTEQHGPFVQPGGPWNSQAAPRALNPTGRPEYKDYQSGKTPYMPGGAQNTTAGNAGTANGKTAADYAAQSDADYQAEYYKKHGYTPGNSPKYLTWQKSQAEYKARRDGVAAQFGEDAAAVWEGYGKLPKDSKAREEYKLAHPELKAYDMAAYNPDEYKAAEKLFGSDAWMEWATAPKSDETPEGKAARQQYMDGHPNAKLLNAWVYGRPSAMGEQEPGEGVKYNFGADFSAAQKQFGDDIWNVFAGYSSAFDKAQKKAYFEKYPKLSEFFGWWYGGDKSAGGTGAGYGRAYGGGYGGGYSGGGGGGGGHGGMGHATRISPRYMDKNLIITDEDLRRNAANAWRPHNINLDWMKAGDRIGPENLKKWRR